MRQMEINVKFTYFDWLKKMVRGDSHNELLWALHHKYFKYYVPNDDNRAYEGINLRDRFCESEDIDPDASMAISEATMLELIVGLAIRCYHITEDNADSMSVDKWFWKILGNTGLDKFTDKYFEELGGRDVVWEILDKIIERTYDRSGIGGLFPLKNAKKDQRKVELWYQMNEYLLENYCFL